MLYRLWIVCLILPALAASEQFAPDLREQTNRAAWLGLVNPTDSALDVTVKGYSADGEHLTNLTLTLPAWGKVEYSTAELHSASNESKPETPLAWARISSPGLPVGYVRYAGTAPRWMTIAPLARTAGAELWVPQIAAGTFAPKTVLVNTGAAAGTATSAPTNATDAETTDQTGAEVPDFGVALGQAELNYGALYAKPEQLAWDHLRGAELAMTGLQFLGTDASNPDRGAAWVLPRTPSRRLVVGPLLPLRAGGWNKVVLINTNQTELRVDITPHYSWYGQPPYDFTYQSQPYTIVLATGERRELDIDHPDQQSLPAVADWLELQSYDGGLLGYQLFGRTGQTTVSAVDIDGAPGSNRVLPHLVSNATLSTTISIVNTSEREGNGYITGYTSQGQAIASTNLPRLRAYEKRDYTMEQLFANRAGEVAWALVRNTNGHLVAHSVTSRRDRTALMGFSAVPTIATTEEPLYAADMERHLIGNLFALGWAPVTYTNAGEVYEEGYYGDIVYPGKFFIEDAFNGDTGYFYLGYEPYHSANPLAVPYGLTERVALTSPYIEVPLYGTWYLNYRMRFHNPQDAQWESRYGLMWREEGSEDWHWFGVSGRNLLEPDDALADCWVDIEWRNLIVTVTGWYPMETMLPPETAGKRIQVAYYYDHQPKSTADHAPWMFMDSIRIVPKANPWALHYVWGQGTLTPADLAAFDDNFPLPPPVTP